MLDDIVVDTNVLVHAGNPDEPLSGAAVGFMSALQACQTSICVDEGFDLNPARNRSYVGHEYLQHLRAGSIGYMLVTYLASNSRVKIISKSLDPAILRRVNQRILNRKDRTFFRVTLNSVERVLASHDYTDFSQAKRDGFCKELGATVCSAAEATPLLVAD